MKKMLMLLCVFCLSMGLQAQFEVSNYQENWDNIPPEAQKKGFSLQKSILVQMDDDPQLENVLLFGHDLGHYPEFDLFVTYYAIVDNYTHKVKYLQEGNFVYDKYDLTVEDRNNDGRFELYRKYFKDNKYTTNPDGYDLQVINCCDKIEWNANIKTNKRK